MDWPATRWGREEAWERLSGPPFALADTAGTAGPGTRARGLARMLDWLADQPGQTWQQRWLASGAEAAGAGWRQVPVSWLHEHGRRSQWLPSELSAALKVVMSADLLRPSLGWLVSAAPLKGDLAREFALSRDPEGYGRLRMQCESYPGISAGAGRRTLQRCSVIIAAKGGALRDITVGDVLELLDTETDMLAAWPRDVPVFYQTLRDLGIFGDQAPARLRELRTGGQRTPDELVDRYQIACRPVRDLLVDYLRERQPRLDYNSLKDLSYYLGKRFWKDLELHHPGIDSLHLPAEVAAAWRQRLLTKPKTLTTQDGEKSLVSAPRISYRQCLTTVRAFYLDLSRWAVEDPARWAPWAAPCPISQDEIDNRKYKRRHKARMDARTRERLPVLPVLVRTVDQRRRMAEALLHAARETEPGNTFTIGGQTLTRSLLAPGTTITKTWVDGDPQGRRRDLRHEEEHAFWAWAAVEILRLTGVFSWGP